MWWRVSVLNGHQDFFFFFPSSSPPVKHPRSVQHHFSLAADCALTLVHCSQAISPDGLFHLCYFFFPITLLMAFIMIFLSLTYQLNVLLAL